MDPLPPPDAEPGPGPRDAVRAAHARFRAWLFDRALPFWAGPGHEGALGSAEHLRLDGSPGGAAFKRMRVQARQIYVFSHAALLGWAPGEELARQGYDFICRAGERADGGWCRQLSPAGEPLDPAADLYDQAFVLFALAWYARLTGGAEPMQRAQRTVAWIRAHMPSPPAGFRNVLPMEAGPRQQNPHMHLLEAALALHETSGEGFYLELARELVALFRRHLFDPRTGTLGEFFADDWSPAPGEAGQHVEPGHHYEWVWLLDQHEQRAGLADMGGEIEGLYRFARRHGTDPDSALVWDAVARDGRVLQRSARLWPQTEALKAHAVMARRGDPEAAALVPQTASNLLGRYLAGCPDGAWIDQLDAAGRPAAERIPASSFYHLMMGYAELDRLAGQPG